MAFLLDIFRGKIKSGASESEEVDADASLLPGLRSSPRKREKKTSFSSSGLSEASADGANPTLFGSIALPDHASHPEAILHAFVSPGHDDATRILSRKKSSPCRSSREEDGFLVGSFIISLTSILELWHETDRDSSLPSPLLPSPQTEDSTISEFHLVADEDEENEEEGELHSPTTPRRSVSFRRQQKNKFSSVLLSFGRLRPEDGFWDHDRILWYISRIRDWHDLYSSSISLSRECEENDTLRIRKRKLLLFGLLGSGRTALRNLVWKCVNILQRRVFDQKADHIELRELLRLEGQGVLYSDSDRRSNDVEAKTRFYRLHELGCSEVEEVVCVNREREDMKWEQMRGLAEELCCPISLAEVRAKMEDSEHERVRERERRTETMSERRNRRRRERRHHQQQQRVEDDSRIDLSKRFRYSVFSSCELISSDLHSVDPSIYLIYISPPLHHIRHILKKGIVSQLSDSDNAIFITEERLYEISENRTGIQISETFEPILSAIHLLPLPENCPDTPAHPWRNACRIVTSSMLEEKNGTVRLFCDVPGSRPLVHAIRRRSCVALVLTSDTSSSFGFCRHLLSRLNPRVLGEEEEEAVGIGIGIGSSTTSGGLFEAMDRHVQEVVSSSSSTISSDRDPESMDPFVLLDEIVGVSLGMFESCSVVDENENDNDEEREKITIEGVTKDLFQPSLIVGSSKSYEESISLMNSLTLLLDLFSACFGLVKGSFDLSSNESDSSLSFLKEVINDFEVLIQKINRRKKIINTSEVFTEDVFFPLFLFELLDLFLKFERVFLRKELLLIKDQNFDISGFGLNQRRRKMTTQDAVEMLGLDPSSSVPFGSLIGDFVRFLHWDAVKWKQLVPFLWTSSLDSIRDDLEGCITERILQFRVLSKRLKSLTKILNRVERNILRTKSAAPIVAKLAKVRVISSFRQCVAVFGRNDQASKKVVFELLQAGIEAAEWTRNPVRSREMCNMVRVYWKRKEEVVDMLPGYDYWMSLPEEERTQQYRRSDFLFEDEKDDLVFFAQRLDSRMSSDVERAEFQKPIWLNFRTVKAGGIFEIDERLFLERCVILRKYSVYTKTSSSEPVPPNADGSLSYPSSGACDGGEASEISFVFPRGLDAVRFKLLLEQIRNKQRDGKLLKREPYGMVNFDSAAFDAHHALSSLDSAFSSQPSLGHLDSGVCLEPSTEAIADVKWWRKPVKKWLWKDFVEAMKFLPMPGETYSDANETFATGLPDGIVDAPVGIANVVSLFHVLSRRLVSGTTGLALLEETVGNPFNELYIDEILDTLLESSKWDEREDDGHQLSPQGKIAQTVYDGKLWADAILRRRFLEHIRFLQSNANTTFGFEFEARFAVLLKMTRRIAPTHFDFDMAIEQLDTVDLWRHSVRLCTLRIAFQALWEKGSWDQFVEEKCSILMKKSSRQRRVGLAHVVQETIAGEVIDWSRIIYDLHVAVCCENGLSSSVMRRVDFWGSSDRCEWIEKLVLALQRDQLNESFRQQKAIGSSVVTPFVLPINLVLSKFGFSHATWLYFSPVLAAGELLEPILSIVRQDFPFSLMHADVMIGGALLGLFDDSLVNVRSPVEDYRDYAVSYSMPCPLICDETSFLPTMKRLAKFVVDANLNVVYHAVDTSRFLNPLPSFIESKTQDVLPWNCQMFSLALFSHLYNDPSLHPSKHSDHRRLLLRLFPPEFDMYLNQMGWILMEESKGSEIRQELDTDAGSVSSSSSVLVLSDCGETRRVFRGMEAPQSKRFLHRLLETGKHLLRLGTVQKTFCSHCEMIDYMRTVCCPFAISDLPIEVPVILATKFPGAYEMMKAFAGANELVVSALNYLRKSKKISRRRYRALLARHALLKRGSRRGMWVFV